MSDTTAGLDPFFNPKPKKTPTPIPEETPVAESKPIASESKPQQSVPISIDKLVEDKSTTTTASVPTVIPTPKVAAPQIIAKQGTKISFKTFAIGCGIFFGLFIILVIVGLYIAINNPSSLSNLGLDISTVKSVLLIFTLLLFGLLFFVGFGFAALNGYRFFTTKTGSRVRYIVGLVGGLVLLFGSIGLGLVSYTTINAISEEQTYNTNDMIIPHIQVKKFDDGDPSLPYSRLWIGTQGLPLIAPTYMDMQLNRQIAQSLGLLNLQLTKLSIDCGNGQTFSNDPNQISTQFFFQGSCLYLKKGQYNVKMNYTYFDPQQGTEITQSIDKAATIDIATDFDFNVDNADRSLNDNKNEVILGTAPVKVLIDAQKIFTDLNIPNIQIARDINGDGATDKQNRVNFTYYFDEAKLYNSYFSIPLNIPGVPSQIWYLTRFRVNAGDVPPCTLETNPLGNNKYEVAVKVDDGGTDISDYSVDIIDNQTDEIVRSLKGTSARFQYDFPSGKSYRVRGYFNTTEGKRGSCEAKSLLDIGYNSYSFINTISVIGPNDSAYKVLGTSGDQRIEGDTIILSDIPTTLKLAIDKIVPDVNNPQITVFENNILKNPTKENEYVFKIDSENEKEIRVAMSDNNGKSAGKLYTVKLERKNLVGQLKATKTVGFDPLIVEFDASITKLNDPNDEVVYFTRDFGDGEVRKNTSVGKITHTYKFDTVKESGEFQPSVTVKTKKGLTQTIIFAEKIIVKRQIRSFEILMPSHPAQLAQAGDTVDFALQADGKVTAVTWDFGNGKKLNGQAREFMDTSMKYDIPGLYEIFVTLEFSDNPPVTQSIKLKVE